MVALIASLFYIAMVVAFAYFLAWALHMVLAAFGISVSVFICWLILVLVMAVLGTIRRK